MPISKGSPYGAPGRLPEDGVVCRSDVDARAALERARHERRPFPPLGLTGGDLARTLGGRGALEVTFPVDVGEVLLDGRLHLFVAHLVARTPAWSTVFVAMNAQWLGSWNLGPRAHPNDGLLDTYDARHLSVADRLKIRSRLRHGTHLPHPAVRERRAPATEVDWRRPIAIYLDGGPVGRARTVVVRARPDALTVVV